MVYVFCGERLDDNVNKMTLNNTMLGFSLLELVGVGNGYAWVAQIK